MTLEPDSPMLSEWLDGRLSGDEADAVAAAVRANPKLTAIATELRRVKQALLEAGDHPVESTGSLVSSVMAALAGEAPGDEDPFANAVSGDSGIGTRPPHDETDEEVDEKVEEEWQRLEKQRLLQDRAEAFEDEDAIREARRMEGPSAGSDRHWLKPALSISLAAGLLVAVLLNIGDQTATDTTAPPLQQTNAVAALERPQVDPVALAERMIARGIELTEGRQSMGTLHMTIHLGDREGRRQFEELLARSRVKLDREETMTGGRVERIGCLGRAAEVDRLLETLAVSTGSVVVQTGSLSREAIDRLERRGPVAEPMLAAADAELKTATEPQPAATAIAAADQAQPTLLTEDVAVAADVGAQAAGLAVDAAAPPVPVSPPTEALAQNDAPNVEGRSLAMGRSQGGPAIGAMSRVATIEPAPIVTPPADAATQEADAPPPPPQLIPPEGFVRLWIDIVDDTRLPAATPAETPAP
ncbi:MAG: hypothetical protein ACO3NZ_06100 [Pirellulales bacterium]